jgi:AraC family transcriptional regulator, regulatory protein of adaptative response / methylated-DNA-[protein]-cysteine methyltransferase
MTSMPRPKEMETAFYKRDASYDGIFFTGVKTTGIFCRPSCTARKPLRENLQFFPSIKEAHFAGFRPCKRCDPLNVNGSSPAWVQELLRELDRDSSVRLKDGNLRQRGLQPEKVRRYFLKTYGMTFQAFCRGKRLGTAFEQIRNGSDLTGTAFDVGYESNSGFREAFGKIFGGAPGKKRREEGGVLFSWVETPMGPMVAGATAKGICLLEFSDRRMLETQLKTLKTCFGDGVVPGSNAHLDKLKKELAEYFEGERKEFSLTLDFPGSEFQTKVWNQLRKIPYGVTCTYEDIARNVGSPKAVRAVGTANGKNRIAIVIPCHRVVNKGGKLGGYGGGVWRKQKLLQLEKATLV